MSRRRGATVAQIIALILAALFVALCISADSMIDRLEQADAEQRN